jgi:heat shock protein HtpX
MEMCVDNPRSGFADLFATHPPIKARIDTLVSYAGGRLPGALEPTIAGEESRPALEALPA